MNEREALLRSWAKWWGVRNGWEEEKGTINCPLCKKYFMVCCRDCPIREATGKAGCRDTPYEKWAKWWDKYWEFHWKIEDAIIQYSINEFTFHLADEECKFLAEIILYGNTFMHEPNIKVWKGKH